MLRNVQPDLLFLAVIALSLLFGFFFYLEGRARSKGRPMHIKLLTRRERFHRISPQSYFVGGDFPYVALVEASSGEVLFVESLYEIPSVFRLNFKGEVVPVD